MFFSHWAKNLIFLVVYILSGAALVLVIEGLMSGSELIPFNTAVERTMVYIRTPFLTNSMIFITNIGSPFVLASLAAIASVGLVMKGNTRDAVLIVLSLAVAVLSFIVLKETFQVSRPATQALHLSGWSFPSGHTTVATAFFFIMAHSFFRYFRNPWSRACLILSSILGAGLVALSRLYLGAHWGLDILAGVALGLLSVSFTVLVSSVFLKERYWKRAYVPRTGRKLGLW